MLDRRFLYYAALGIVLTLAFPALGQGTSESQGRQNDQKETGQSRTEQTADQPAEEPDSAVADDTPPPTDVSADNGEGNQQVEESISPNQPPGVAGPIYVWGETIAQWAMAIAGVTAVFISGWAVWLLWKTLQATRVMIAEARHTTVTAEQAVVVARATLDETRKSAERQLRAYMSIDEVSFAWESNRTARAHVTIKNTGQTPAYNMTHIVGLSPANTGINPTEVSHVSKNDVGPGVDMNSIARTDPMSAEEWNGVRARTIPLYLEGEIKYIDAFDTPRFVNYKMMLIKGEDIMTPCEDGNESN